MSTKDEKKATLPPNVAQRLVLARLIFDDARRSSLDSSSIARIKTIVMLDLATEMFLKTLVSHFGKPSTYLGTDQQYFNTIDSLEKRTYSPERADFGRLLDEVTGIFGDPKRNINRELRYKQEIMDLHNLRNHVQHAGATPSHDDILRFVRDVGDFLGYSTTLAFKVAFKELTELTLIGNQKLRLLMKESKEDMANGNYKESIKKSTEAFARLHITLKSNFPFLDFGSPMFMGTASDSNDVSELSDEVDDFATEVGSALDDISDVLASLMIGADTRSLSRFLQIAPRWSFRADKNMVRIRETEDWEPDEHDARDAFDFVFLAILSTSEWIEARRASPKMKDRIIL